MMDFPSPRKSAVSPSSSPKTITGDDGTYDMATVAEVLKTKRKPRSVKSCFPCRHRKVRCDGRTPCSSCVRRQHPSLCRPANATGAGAGNSSPRTRSYPLPGSSHGEGPTSAAMGSAGVSADVRHVVSRLEEIEDKISSLKAELLRGGQGPSTDTSPLDHPASLASILNDSVDEQASIISRLSPRPTAMGDGVGNHYVEAATGATIFLGAHSDPPLVLGCRKLGDPQRSSALSDQLVPKAYMFENIWSREITLADLGNTLPSDSDIIRYWQVYQTSVHPFYPGLVTSEAFSASLFAFLDRRLASGKEDTIPEGTESCWLGLLFSVLACGAQFSSDAIKERDLRSKVFVCSSFQCLRFSNFFATTNVEQIQALALLGHCLRNNIDMNSAWILMGTTIRLAQSIGLHVEGPQASPFSPGTRGTSLDYIQRKRLWWTLVWQDTFLALTYDRPLDTPYSHGTILEEHHSGGGLTLASAIMTMCATMADRASHAGLTPPTSPSALQDMLRFKREFEGIIPRAAPFLTDKSRCQTLQNHLERLAFQIHFGYVVCRILRLCLEGGDGAVEWNAREALALEYREHTVRVVQSFLDMHRMSSVVCRSWAFVHNVASCVILLGSLASVSPVMSGEAAGDPRPLIRRLIDVLAAEARKSEWYDSDTNVRHFGPYSRVVEALKETYGDI